MAGREDAALPHLETVLRLQPGDVGVMNNLAWLLANSTNPSVRDASRAVRLAEEACKVTTFKEPALLDTLAAAYAAAGRFDEAVNTAETALKLAEKHDPSLAERIGERLAGYEKQRDRQEDP